MYLCTSEDKLDVNDTGRNGEKRKREIKRRKKQRKKENSGV